MGSLPIRVGLVDMTGTINPEMLSAVAAALDVQVTRDLPQYWDVKATVVALPHKDKIPQGVWPVQLVKSLPPGEGGFHLTKKHNQPYAKVVASGDNNDWTIDASHETLEMLCDAAGNRLQVSEAIKIAGNSVVDDPHGGKFEYLVEVCDPCEANDFGYQIDGYLMSDFITPHFYDQSATSSARYSFTGAITRPRQILKGGYISFINENANEVQQILWLGEAPQMRDLGPASGASLREFVETKTRSYVNEQRRPSSHSFGAYREKLAAAAMARARLYI
jgi:hypothetical protein